MKDNMIESFIWTEKYRPKKLDEVINQKHVVESLKSWIKEKGIPHIILAGPAGIGKTTIALCIARELFGDTWRDNLLETNASDERGIDIVRGKIKDFARTKPIGSDFRIIFLDEADSLTPEAQQALRRTIERFSNVCRFILSCNYSNRLIEPIQSRCAVFRLKQLSKEDVYKFIDRIVEGEKITITEDGKEAIYKISEGDLRKVANLLQASSTFGKVTEDVVFNVAAQAKPKDIKEMVAMAMKGDFLNARKKLHDLIINQGLSGEDIIKAIHREIFNLDMDDEKRLKFIEKIGEYEFRMNQGSNELLQLEALLAQFCG